jgi:hypothetical protein
MKVGIKRKKFFIGRMKMYEPEWLLKNSCSNGLLPNVLME